MNSSTWVKIGLFVTGGLLSGGITYGTMTTQLTAVKEEVEDIKDVQKEHDDQITKAMLERNSTSMDIGYIKKQLDEMLEILKELKQ